MIKITFSTSSAVAFVIVFLLGMWAVEQSGLLNALAIIAGQTVMWCVIYSVRELYKIGSSIASSSASFRDPHRPQAPKAPAPLTE